MFAKQDFYLEKKSVMLEYKEALLKKQLVGHVLQLTEAFFPGPSYIPDYLLDLKEFYQFACWCKKHSPDTFEQIEVLNFSGLPLYEYDYLDEGVGYWVDTRFKAVCSLIELNLPIKKLLLDSTEISEHDVGALCASLKKNSHLVSISLQDNSRISDAGKERIMQALLANRGQHGFFAVESSNVDDNVPPSLSNQYS